MAIRKPNGGAKAASTAPLTSVQDTRSRGNGNGNGERVLMSFKIPSDLKMCCRKTRGSVAPPPAASSSTASATSSASTTKPKA